MLIHWIWFATRTGMGDKMKSVLLSHFEDPEAIYFAPELEFEHILAGEVFIRPNVRIIRRVCICCLAVCLICLPAAVFYPPLIFLCVIMAFLCPVVNVVRYVFDAAVTIREENDLTI